MIDGGSFILASWWAGGRAGARRTPLHNTADAFHLVSADRGVEAPNRLPPLMYKNLLRCEGDSERETPDGHVEAFNGWTKIEDPPRNRSTIFQYSTVVFDIVAQFFSREPSDERPFPA